MKKLMSNRMKELEINEKDLKNDSTSPERQKMKNNFSNKLADIC